VKSPTADKPPAEVKNDAIKKSPSHTKFGEELPVYTLRKSRRSRNDDSITEPVSEPVSPRKQSTPVATPTRTIRPDGGRPRPDYEISAEEEKQMNLSGSVSRYRRKDSELSNGHIEDISDKSDTSPEHTKPSATRDRLKVRAYQEFEKDVALEKNKRKTIAVDEPAKPVGRSGSIGRSASIGRTGSFKRRQQMDGDKALGMCYQ